MGEFADATAPLEFLERLQSSYYQEEIGSRYESVLDRYFSRRASLVEPGSEMRARWSGLHPMVAKALSRDDVQRELVRKTSRLPGVLYSKYEDPILRNIIDTTRLSLTSVLERTNLFEKFSRRADARDVVIGSLPDASFNAAAIKIPDGNQYVIVLNTGLFDLLIRISKIVTYVSALLPMSGPHFALDGTDWSNRYSAAVDRVLEGSDGEQLTKEFAATILDYCAIEHDLKVDLDSASKDLTRLLGGEYAIGAERFVLAHEYCHILCGDFLKDKTHIKCALPDGQSIQIKKLKHAQEIAADLIGSSIASVAANQYPNERGFDQLLNFQLLGPYLFLRCGDFVSKYETLFSAEKIIPNTHPPTRKRMELWWAQIGSLNLPLMHEMVQMLEITITQLLERSWQYCATAADNRPS